MKLLKRNRRDEVEVTMISEGLSSAEIQHVLVETQ